MQWLFETLMRPIRFIADGSIVDSDCASPLIGNRKIFQYEIKQYGQFGLVLGPSSDWRLPQSPQNIVLVDAPSNAGKFHDTTPVFYPRVLLRR